MSSSRNSESSSDTSRKACHKFSNIGEGRYSPDEIFKDLKERKFTDVVIKCRGETMHLHKFVIIESCSFFRAAFQEDAFLEGATGVLDMSDDDPEILKLVIGTIYLSNIDTSNLLKGHTNHLQIVIRVYVLGDKLGANDPQDWAVAELEGALQFCMLKLSVPSWDSTPLGMFGMRASMAKVAWAVHFMYANLLSTSDKLKGEFIRVLQLHWKDVVKGLLREDLRQLFLDVPEFGFDMFMGELVPERPLVMDVAFDVVDQSRYKYDW